MDSRTVICNNIINIINSLDDKTLREFEGMVIGWTRMKRRIKFRQEV